MKTYTITGPNRPICSTIKLSGSKSIANRVLIIRALCKEDFMIENLSDSDDTKTLDRLLSGEQDIYDVGHAGTTFRFLTSYLAMQKGSQTLTGSERMKQRPIGPLVTALNELGANIEYLGKPGYPPLQINAPTESLKSSVNIAASVSSQYLSSLLLIAPSLEKGLTLHLEGEMVSKPYLDMTLAIMKKFGVDATWENNSIVVKPQPYQARDFFVEADWSAASYHYAIAAISRHKVKLTLEGLVEGSTQGDSKMSEIASSFGVSTEYQERAITITNENNHLIKQMLDYNFIEQPDIAQTVFVMCAALGKPGLFSGLKTLKIKETDRIKACQDELNKIEVFLTKVPKRFKGTDDEHYMIDGKAKIGSQVSFDTYHDHRMAMAFAPLALLSPIRINDPMVVTKSYPAFYEDLESMGFEVDRIASETSK